MGGIYATYFSNYLKYIFLDLISLGEVYCIGWDNFCAEEI